MGSKTVYTLNNCFLTKYLVFFAHWYSDKITNFCWAKVLKNCPTHQQHGHATRRQDLPRKRWHVVMEKVGRPRHPGYHQEDCPGSPLHNSRGYRAAQLSLYETGSDIFYFWNIKRKYRNRCIFLEYSGTGRGERGRVTFYFHKLKPGAKTPVLALAKQKKFLKFS